MRETREETGLDSVIDSLFGTFHFVDDPRGSGILIVYLAHVMGGKPRPDREATQVEWFARSSLPTLIAGGGHDSALRRWAAL